MCSRTFRLEASYSQAVLAHLHLEKWPDGLLDETMSNLPEQLAHHSGWLPHLRGVLWVLTSLRLAMRKNKTTDCSLDILSGVALELLRGVVIDVARLVFLRRELGKGDRLLLSLISSFFDRSLLQLVREASLEILPESSSGLLLVLPVFLAILRGSLGSYQGFIEPG